MSSLFKLNQRLASMNCLLDAGFIRINYLPKSCDRKNEKKKTHIKRLLVIYSGYKFNVQRYYVN